MFTSAIYLFFSASSLTAFSFFAINCYCLYSVHQLLFFIVYYYYLFSTILFARYTVYQADITTVSVSCVQIFLLLFSPFFLVSFLLLGIEPGPADAER